MAKKDEAKVSVAAEPVEAAEPTTVRMCRYEKGGVKYADVHPAEAREWSQHGWVKVE